MPPKYMRARKGNDCGRARQKRTRTPDDTAEGSRQDDEGVEMRETHQQKPRKADAVLGGERHAGVLSDKGPNEHTLSTRAELTKSLSVAEINVVDEDDDDLQLALALSASLADSTSDKAATICSNSKNHGGLADLQLSLSSRENEEESQQQEELVLVDVADSSRYNSNGSGRTRKSIDCSGRGNISAIRSHTRVTTRSIGKSRKNRGRAHTSEPRYKKLEGNYTGTVCNDASTSGPSSPRTADTSRRSVSGLTKNRSNNGGINNTVDSSGSGSIGISSLHRTRSTTDPSSSSSIPVESNEATVGEFVSKSADKVFPEETNPGAEVADSSDQAQQEGQLSFYGPQQPISTGGAPHVCWCTRSRVTGQREMLGSGADDDEALWRNAFGERRRERRERRRGLSSFDDDGDVLAADGPGDMEPVLCTGGMKETMFEMHDATSEERTNSDSHSTVQSMLPATCAACRSSPSYPATAAERDNTSGDISIATTSSSTAPDGCCTRGSRTNHCDSSNSSSSTSDTSRGGANRRPSKTFMGNASIEYLSSGGQRSSSSSSEEACAEERGRRIVEQHGYGPPRQEEGGVHPALFKREAGALQEEQSAQRASSVCRSSQIKRVSVRFRQQVSVREQGPSLQPREQQQRRQQSPGQLSSVTASNGSSAAHEKNLVLDKGQENEIGAAGRPRTGCRQWHRAKEHRGKTVKGTNGKRERKRRKKSSGEETEEQDKALTDESTTTISDEKAADFPDDEDDEETQFQVALAVSLSAADPRNSPVSCHHGSTTSMASSSSSSRSLKDPGPATASGSVGSCAQSRRTALPGTADTPSSTDSSSTTTSTNTSSTTTNISSTTRASSRSASRGDDGSTSFSGGSSSGSSNGSGSSSSGGSSRGKNSDTSSESRCIGSSGGSTGVNGCDSSTRGSDSRSSCSGDCDSHNSGSNGRDSSSGDRVSRVSSHHVSGKKENKDSTDKAVHAEGWSCSPPADTQESKESGASRKNSDGGQNLRASVDGLIIYKRRTKCRCVTISKEIHSDMSGTKESFRGMPQRADDCHIDFKEEYACSSSTETACPAVESVGDSTVAAASAASLAATNGEFAPSPPASDTRVNARVVSGSTGERAAAVIGSPALDDCCIADLSALAPSTAAIRIAARPTPATATRPAAPAAARKRTGFNADTDEGKTRTTRPTAGAPGGTVASRRSGPAAAAAVSHSAKTQWARFYCVSGDSEENSLSDHSSDSDFEPESRKQLTKRKSRQLVSEAQHVPASTPKMARAHETSSSSSDERTSLGEAVEEHEEKFTDSEGSEEDGEAKHTQGQATQELRRRTPGRLQQPRQQRRQQGRKRQLEEVQQRQQERPRKTSEWEERGQRGLTMSDVPFGLSVTLEKGGHAGEEEQSDEETSSDVDAAAVAVGGALSSERATADVGDNSDMREAHFTSSHSPSQRRSCPPTTKRKPREAETPARAAVAPAERVEADFDDPNSDAQKGDPEEKKIWNGRQRDVWVSKIPKKERDEKNSRRSGQQQRKERNELRSEANAAAAAAVKLWKHEKLHDACLYVWAALTQAIPIPLQQTAAGVRTNMRLSEGVQRFLKAIDEQRHRQREQQKRVGTEEPEAGGTKSVADILSDSRADRHSPLQGRARPSAVATQKWQPGISRRQQQRHSEEQQDLRLPTAEQLQQHHQQLPPPLPFITLEQLGRAAAAVGLLNVDVDELLKMIATAAAAAGAASIAEKQQQQQQQQQQPEPQVGRWTGKMGSRRTQQGILSSKACRAYYSQALGKTTLSLEEFVAFFHYGLGLKVESNGKVW